MPSRFKMLWRLDKRESSWGEAMELLMAAGFELAAQSTRSRAPWPEDLDPMGPEPAGVNPGDQRHFALLSHQEGFVVTMSSYRSEGVDRLNELTISHQTDIGAGLGDRRESEGSGSPIALGDGTSIWRGRLEIVNGHHSLAGVLEERYRQARPLPLERWDPDFFHVDPGLFTAAPAEAMGWHGHKNLVERFEARVDADWRSFIQRLPTDLARVVDHQQTVVQNPRPRRDPRDPPSHGYMARQLEALGENWPSRRDSELLRSWSQAMASSRATGQALDMRSPGARALGGANALHVVAAASPWRHDEQGEDPLLGWVKAQNPRDLSRWLAQRDAGGRTPAGVALEASLRDWRFDEAPASPMVELFLERGWVGEPGEWGQIAHDLLAGPDKSWSDRRERFDARHVDLLNFILARSPEARWLAPIATKDGVARAPSEAIESFLAKLRPGQGARQAEALALRAQALFDAPSRPSGPRL